MHISMLLIKRQGVNVIEINVVYFNVLFVINNNSKFHTFLKQTQSDLGLQDNFVIHYSKQSDNESKRKITKTCKLFESYIFLKQ